MTNNDNAWFTVTLRDWLESQRLEHTPHRAALNDAMENGDTTAIRNLLDEAPFTTPQRRYLDDLLDRWDHSLNGLHVEPVFNRELQT